MATSLSGTLAISPGNGGNLQVIALGTDGTPNLIWQDNNSGTWHWYGPLPHEPGVSFTALAAGIGSGGNLQVITIGDDGVPYRILQGAGTGTWTSAGPLPHQAGLGLTSVAIGVGNGGNLQAIVLDKYGDPYLIWQDNNSGIWHWYGALPHKAGVGFTALATGIGFQNDLNVIAIGKDGVPYLISQSSSGVWSSGGALPWHAPGPPEALVTGVGNLGNLQVVCTTSIYGPFLIWQDHGVGRWSYFSGLPNEIGNIGVLTAAPGHLRGNLQVIVAGGAPSGYGQVPYVIWQDNQIGSWNFYGPTPFEVTETFPILGIAAGFGFGALQTVVVGGDNVPYLVWQDQSSGNWNFFGALPTG